MKIVYISNSYIPSKEANSVNVMNMCNAFQELGHEIVLYTPNAKFGIEKDVSDIHEFYGVDKKVKIRRLIFPNIIGKPYFFAFHVYLALLKDKPDYVVGRSIHGLFVASKLNIPFTFDSHGPIWDSGILAHNLFKKVITNPSFRKLTTNSKALKDIYLDRYPGLRDKICVAFNGAKDYDDEYVNLPGRNVLKVGYFGHLYKGRGIEIIIELASSFNEFDFIIVGGTVEDVSLWKNKVGDLSNLYFVGFVNPSMVYRYRNSCDILLAPYQRKVIVARGKVDSSQYMNPIKLFEYLQSGKPIIASDLGPIKDVLSYRNSILVSPDKVDEWKVALSRLCSDSKLRKQLGDKAKLHYKENYTWKIRANKMLRE